jgi:hypothetical protein
VEGPANCASLIGGIACLLKNPNLCVDARDAIFPFF